MSTAEAHPFAQQMQRIEQLVQAVEQSADEKTRAAASELVRSVLDLHAAGFAKILELLSQAGEEGRAVREACVRDELLSSLLSLHGLHPVDLEKRVEQALEDVRPHLQSHGGNVELLEIADGIVRLRMQGSCHGCASSQATLKLLIERAIYDAAPDVDAIELVEDSAPSGLMQLEVLPTTPALNGGE